MNITQKARALTQGITESRQSVSSQLANEDGGRKGGVGGLMPDIIQRVDTENLGTLNTAIEKLYSVICSFSAVTDRVEIEKREIYKLGEEVKNQKLEAGKLLYELDKVTKSFPRMASTSIESSVGATSQNLHNSINSLVTEIRGVVLEIFKQQIYDINRAAAKTTESAETMENAKKTFGWQSLGINLFAVSLASILLIVFITPRLPEYRPNAEEQRQIKNGKFIEATWPKLSQKTQQEIQAANLKK